MTLMKNENGRKILEGTVHVAIVFSEEGDILTCWASKDKRKVEEKGNKFIELEVGFGLPLPLIRYTMATHREVV